MLYQIELKNKLRFNQFKYQQIVKHQLPQEAQLNSSLPNSHRSQQALLSSARRSRTKKIQSIDSKYLQPTILRSQRQHTSEMRYSSTREDPGSSLGQRISPIKDLEPHLIQLNQTDTSYRSFLQNKRKFTEDFSRPLHALSQTDQDSESKGKTQLRSIFGRGNRREEFRPQTQGNKRSSIKSIHD